MTSIKKVFVIIILFNISTYGCKYKCSCDCEYYLEKTTLKAKWSTNDSLVATKVLYTHNTFSGDPSYLDSIQKFNNIYQSPNYTVTRKDSTYNYDKIEVRCYDSPNDYVCICEK